MNVPIEHKLFDGLGSLLTLADEAEQGDWTLTQVIAQVRDIVGDTHDGLWHEALLIARELEARA